MKSPNFVDTVHKMKFFFFDLVFFFFLDLVSCGFGHILKKYLMENFIFLQWECKRWWWDYVIVLSATNLIRSPNLVLNTQHRPQVLLQTRVGLSLIFSKILKPIPNEASIWSHPYNLAPPLPSLLFLILVKHFYVSTHKWWVVLFYRSFCHKDS